MSEKWKEAVTQEGLLLSVNEGGKERKGKMITSYSCLEETLGNESAEVGAGLSDCVEMLGHGGWARKSKKKVKQIIDIIHKTKACLQGHYMRKGVKHLLKTGLVHEKIWGGTALGIPPSERWGLKRKMAEVAGKALAVPLSWFLEAGFGTIWQRSVEQKLCGWDDGTRSLKSAGECECGEPPAGSKCAEQRVRWSAKTTDSEIGFPKLACTSL